MTFWESVKIATGMQQKGVVPTGLVLEKASLDAKLFKLDFKGIQEVTQDEVLIARMVHDLIIDKRVMYARDEVEGWQYVKLSLDDVRTHIDKYLDRFEGSPTSKDRLYASMLLTWRAAAKRAVNAGQEAESAEQRDREAYRKFELLDRGDILEVRDALPGILATFRYESYSCAAVLASLLPDGHPARVEAERTLSLTKAYLIERFAHGGEQLTEFSWTIDY